MGNIRRQILLNVFKLFDMVLMVAAFGAATVLMLRASQTVTVAEFFEMRVKIGNFLIFASLLVAWHLLFSTFGLYASRRLSRRSAEIVDSLKATFFATLLLGVGTVVFHIKMATPVVPGSLLDVEQLPNGFEQADFALAAGANPAAWPQPARSADCGHKQPGCGIRQEHSVQT